MKTNHTPGPWALPNNKGTLIYAQNYHPGQTGYIASVNFCKDTNTTMANARLIAAAPELLEAIKMFVQQYEGSPERETRPEMKAARAAIAKATGE